MDSFKVSLTLFLSVLCVAFSYELKDQLSQANQLIKFLGIFLGLVVTPSVANTIVDFLIKFRYMRRLMLGDVWIEGAWFIKTYSESEVISASIAQISYDLPNLEPQVFVYSSQGIHVQGEAFSTSATTVIRKKNLLYLSYFISSSEEKTQVGTALGNFHHDLGAKFTNSYEGKVFYSDHAHPVRQIGEKIPDSTVKKAVQKSSSGWKKLLIEEYLNLVI